MVPMICTSAYSHFCHHIICTAVHAVCVLCSRAHTGGPPPPPGGIPPVRPPTSQPGAGPMMPPFGGPPGGPAGPPPLRPTGPLVPGMWVHCTHMHLYLALPCLATCQAHTTQGLPHWGAACRRALLVGSWPPPGMQQGPPHPRDLLDLQWGPHHVAPRPLLGLGHRRLGSPPRRRAPPPCTAPPAAWVEPLHNLYNQQQG